VIVPMVEDAAEAERAARSCRYPPLGHRSYGPARAAAVVGSTRAEDVADVACIVMVETAAGVRNAAEIAAAGGVDAVYLGPNDLALALGLPPSRTPPDPRLHATIAELLRVCRRAGVAAGIQATDGASALRYAELGFDMITLGTDVGLLTAAVREHLRTAVDNPSSAQAAGVEST
jgi:4-hydroxy-2-oxoheptanedioate aldolase